MTRSRPIPRPLRWGGALAGTALVLLLASFPLFVLPSVDEPEEVRARPADAVVVLGGGHGERVATATALLRRLPDPPPTLVLLVPYDQPLLTCGTAPRSPDVAVRCVVPDPLTTAGEAATITALAAAQRWQRVVVVTSDYHVTRARRLFTRCAERQAPALELVWVAGETEPLSQRGLWMIATEWPSLLATPWDHEAACTGEPDF